MDFKYSDDINITPIQKCKQKCEWSNHVPAFTPRRSDKDKWVEYYMNEIEDMYEIVQRIIEEKFPGKTDWNRQAIFTNLITVLHHCSSKHIGI